MIGTLELFVSLMNGHRLLIYSFTHLLLLDTEELLMEVEVYLRRRTNIEEHCLH